MRRKKVIHGIFVMAALMAIIIPGTVLGEGRKNINLELPQPEVPQPQFFCGYCHILTYPSVFQKGYETWKTGKHGKYGCVECHYPPKKAQESGKTEATGDVKKHIPRKGPERFAYIPIGGETVKKRPRILSESCLTSNCHGSSDDKFRTKKIKFTEKC